MHSWNFLLLLALSLHLGVVLAVDYFCSFTYVGMCHQCPYQIELADCHYPATRTIYQNGKIYTVDPNDAQWETNPQEAMVVEYEAIVYVGTNEGADAYVLPGISRQVDLDGAVVFPGMHDVHMHVQEASNPVAGTCILPSNTSPDDPDLLKVFTEDFCQDDQLGTDWVLGWGFSLEPMLDYIEETGEDPKDLLDPIVVDIFNNPLPCILMEVNSHSVWVNSEALRMAGLTEDVEDANGSIYMRNNVTGELNGMLLENAVMEIMKLAMDPDDYPAVREFAYEGLLNSNLGLFLLASSGITSAIDARVFWHDGMEEVWRRVEEEGRLTARIALALWAYPEVEDEEQWAELRLRRDEGEEGARLRTNHVKLYVDGLLDQRTASLIEDYDEDYPDLGIGDRGMNYFTPDRLTTYLTELGDEFDFLMHTIGDQAVRDALDSVESSNDGYSGGRHKATHLELVDSDDLERFESLGLIADPQVSGVWTLPDAPYHDRVVELVGEERAEDHIPVGSLSEAGALVTLSSDFDVSPISPFEGMANAISRGDQAVTLKEAVEMYTVNGAFSMRQEDKVGFLADGMEADFIVVDRDIFDLESSGDVNSIRTTRVVLTVVQGEEVWNKL